MVREQNRKNVELRREIEVMVETTEREWEEYERMLEVRRAEEEAQAKEPRTEVNTNLEKIEEGKGELNATWEIAARAPVDLSRYVRSLPKVDSLHLK
jgi:hypothetical protein